MRVSFDLDGVLFVPPETYETEDPLRFPLNRFYPNRLRKGSIKLIHTLQEEGFEVWIYTSSFRNEWYIRNLFRHYGIRFDGIVNGFRHLKEVQRTRVKRLPAKLPNYYRISLHIDDEDVVYQNSRLYGFRTLLVSEPDEHWDTKVLAEAWRIRKMENRS